MTHNTPDGTDERRRCGISVKPATGDDGPECPACGSSVD